MRFVWNQEKNRANYAKHGVSFEVACKVFDDPLVTFLFDRVVDEEERWHAVGKALNLPLLVVVHTYRDNSGEDVVRIISARQASSHERRFYEES